MLNAPRRFIHQVAPAPPDMAGDFEIEKGASFGEWLHDHICEAVHFETEAWAIERIQRVQDRLQAGRPESERLIVEIPWLEEVTAFTAPGRYIYFSRRLYERCQRMNRLPSSSLTK